MIDISSINKDYPDLEFERLFDEKWKLPISPSHANLAEKNHGWRNTLIKNCIA